MAKKKAVTKKAVSKRAPRRKASENTDDNGDDDRVTLAELADEANISTQQARQKLRAAGIEREDGKRWSWTPRAKALTAVKKALGL